MIGEPVLQYNYGYAWYTESGISVKGFIFDEVAGLLENSSLVNYFATVRDIASFRARLQQANGLFSVIIRLSDRQLIAVDPVRTFPLFYGVPNGRVSDNAAAAGVAPLRLSKSAAEQFLRAGFVSGRATLLDNVYQLEAGAYCQIDGSGAAPAFYHQFCSDSLDDRPEQELTHALAGMLHQVGQRLVRQLNGRTAVIPLSGGYDSRLIAVLLKKFRYDKVICYTYGATKNAEVRLSEQVARRLGFRWHFVRYDRDLIAGFVGTEAFQTYYPFAANYTSSFFTQDYFAVRHLKEQGLLPEDSVIVPGHTSAFDSGLGQMANLNRANVSHKIVERHFSLRRDLSGACCIDAVAQQLIDASPEEVFENWNVKERLSKFINNANRVYEFWGYQHLIPLWDRCLADFMRNLPVPYRRNKLLYHRVCRDYFFQPAQVDDFLPQFPFVVQKAIGVKNRLKRFLWSDPINFKLIARQLQQDAPLPVKWDSVKININAIQSAWYLSKIKDALPVAPIRPDQSARDAT